MSCVWHEMWRPKRKRDVNTAVCLCWQSILIVYDGVWLQGVDALVERCPGTFRFPSLSFISSPYLTSLILLPVPPSLPLLPSEQSDHPCTLPPPPHPLSLSLCLSFSALPSCLHPQLAAVARHQGQISTPFPASLSSSVFLFLPPLTLHFLCSDAILKFLSLPV